MSSFPRVCVRCDGGEDDSSARYPRRVCTHAFCTFDLSLTMCPVVPPHRLPPSFTSLYRLFLRTSSAAVLHHKAATRYIRSLWIPTFRDTATIILRLQNPTLAIAEKTKLERWLWLWESSSVYTRSSRV